MIVSRNRHTYVAAWNRSEIHTLAQEGDLTGILRVKDGTLSRFLVDDQSRVWFKVEDSDLWFVLGKGGKTLRRVQLPSELELEDVYQGVGLGVLDGRLVTVSFADSVESFSGRSH